MTITAKQAALTAQEANLRALTKLTDEINKKFAEAMAKINLRIEELSAAGKFEFNYLVGDKTYFSIHVTDRIIEDLEGRGFSVKSSFKTEDDVYSSHGPSHYEPRKVDNVYMLISWE
jgi:ribosomal protein L9